MGSTVDYTPNDLNQYSSVGPATYSYDDNGNLTGDGTNCYVYDVENRLLSASVPGHSSIAYTYDPPGRRKSKTVDGVTTTYFYDGDQVICEYDDKGLLKYKYIYGPGIDDPVRRTFVYPSIDIDGSGTVEMNDLYIMAQYWLQATNASNEAADLNHDGSIDNIDSDMLSAGWGTSGSAVIIHYYYHFDGSGNVIALTDSEGYVVARYNYDVFGNVDNTGSVNNVYFFTGRRWDSETGLYYYRARMYNPTIGRFMQPDPIGYDDGPNMYVYCGNNPVNLTDPTGLWFGIDDAVASGVGALVGLISQGIGDIIARERSEWGDYAIAAVSGAAGGEAFLYGGPVAAGGVAAGVGNGLKQLRDWGQDERESLSVFELVGETGLGLATGYLMPGGQINGVTVGRNSYAAIGKQMHTKLQSSLINRVSNKTAAKMAVGQFTEQITGSLTSGLINGGRRKRGNVK